MTTKFRIFYGALLTLAVCMYTFSSSRITPSLTHDEMIYAANAKAIALTGKDSTGNHQAFSIKPIHPMYAEFTASYLIPFFWLFKNPVLASHAVSTLISLSLPFILSWIAFGLFRNHRLSIITAFVVIVSPLNIQFSKLAYDSYVSLFFLLLSLGVYLNTKGFRSLWTVPILFLGFFNYQGYKVIYAPILIVTAIFKFRILGKKCARAELGAPALALLLTLWYGFILLPSQTTANRLDQTIFTDTTKIESRLFDMRSNSLMPFLGQFFAHKAFAIFGLGMDRILGAVNPAMLFLYGEPNTSGFAVWSHGFFYLLDAIAIFLGGAYMFRTSKHRQALGYLAVLAALALVPVSLSTISTWYLLRTLLFYYLLFIFISYGFLFLSYHPKVFAVYISLYLLSIASFGYQYVFRYPIYRSDKAELHERIAIDYARRAAQFQPVIIYDDEPHYLYLSYLLYGDPSKKDILQNATGKYETGWYSAGNIIFTNQCQPENEVAVRIISDLYNPCQNGQNTGNTSINSIIDSGVKYKINNDQLCQNISKNRYVRIASLKDLVIKELNNQDFCAKWIVNQTL